MIQYGHQTIVAGGACEGGGAAVGHVVGKKSGDHIKKDPTGLLE